ncbi:hypothetical protein H632_c404p1 [Helicosporidium sp. ATCC 50920]|nr:hypothetical protein H632_c404p1 [Helicosporidium sp. ATCC 50920]|eukprot:KDD75993.1 hypothetical protein H632_c404p1 [Helicosporidium sp. ATCC 50920]
MPRLTAYYNSAALEAPQDQNNKARTAESRREGNPLVAHSNRPKPERAQESASAAARDAGTAETSAATLKFAADYARRIQHHGPRTFRWPDGTLQSEPPPRSPITVANRRRLNPLVTHCRLAGASSDAALQATRLRYGIEVSHALHEAHLSAAGLRPETDAQGQFLDYRADKDGDPVEHADHCFHTFYRAMAQRVAAEEKGRIANLLPRPSLD